MFESAVFVTIVAKHCCAQIKSVIVTVLLFSVSVFYSLLFSIILWSVFCCLINSFTAHTIIFFYLLKPNKVIVTDEKHDSYPGQNIYSKDSKFSNKLSGQTVQTEISLLLRNRCD